MGGGGRGDNRKMRGERGRKGRRRGGGADPDDTMWVSGAPGCGKGRRVKSGGGGEWIE